jgi:hypothetical protein
MAIDGYYIHGYGWLLYSWLWVAISLMAIGEYFINCYW